jgi:hypothetical protein
LEPWKTLNLNPRGLCAKISALVDQSVKKHVK